MADNRIGVYTPEQASMILDVIKHLKATGYVVRRSEKTPINDGAPRIHLAKISEEVTSREGDEVGIGKAKLRQVFGEVETDRTLEEFPIDEPAEPFVHALGSRTFAVGDYVYLLREYATGKWFALPVESKPRLTGKVTAGAGSFRFPTGDGPFTISEVKGIDAKWNGASTISGVTNPLKLKLWTGSDAYQTEECQVWFEWNVTDEEYQIYSATGNRVVHGVNRADCEFTEIDAEEGLHTWELGYEAEWVESISQDGCKLIYTICGNEFEFLDLAMFVTHVYMDGDCLKINRCGGSGSGTQVFCFEDCPEDYPCGWTKYRAEDDPMTGDPSWQAFDQNCQSPCEPADPPSTPPTAEDVTNGTIVTLPCIEPP